MPHDQMDEASIRQVSLLLPSSSRSSINQQFQQYQRQRQKDRMTASAGTGYDQIIHGFYLGSSAVSIKQIVVKLSTTGVLEVRKSGKDIYTGHVETTLVNPDDPAQETWSGETVYVVRLSGKYTIGAVPQLPRGVVPPEMLEREIINVICLCFGTVDSAKDFVKKVKAIIQNILNDDSGSGSV